MNIFEDTDLRERCVKAIERKRHFPFNLWAKLTEPDPDTTMMLVNSPDQSVPEPRPTHAPSHVFVPNLDNSH